MFTIQQIKEAHAKVKSGADFPAYIQALVQLGVICYDTYVNDGHTEYKGKNNTSLQTGEKYPFLEIATESNQEILQQDLKIHQQGHTDYLTFCKQAAASGVEKWTVDTEKMTCTYKDKNGNIILMENIPLPG